MGRRANQFKVDSLARFLLYVLGRRPDEFGLVPDAGGFVLLKELLQAIHEEPSWRYVRQSHVNEVLCGSYRAEFDAEGDRLSARTRTFPPLTSTPAHPPPKLLYTAVRRKAHPVVMDKGLWAPEGRLLVLSDDRAMALRIGTRRDRKPVVLEVTAAAAAGEVSFRPFLTLFVCEHIPAEYIAGPPVSKEAGAHAGEKEEKRAAPAVEPVAFAPGTFVLDESGDPDRSRKAKGKKRKGWKEDARKMRQGKR